MTFFVPMAKSGEGAAVPECYYILRIKACIRVLCTEISPLLFRIIEDPIGCADSCRAPLF